MKIKLYGSLRQKAGAAEHETTGTTVHEALANLCTYHDALRTAIFDGAALRAHVRVMVNGHDCELADGLETAVSANDQIAIFPPIAGG
ncbi:MAG: ubiquitin-like small modifier protein 1 [Chloroflexota bacterium]|nr:MoaD/ThiS family protein [Ardenticatenaceae bacterium]